MSAGVTLEGVRKAFGSVVAVDDVDMELPAGRITAVLGPSGCGKTTTLRLVAGFEVPDRGTVRIGDRTVAGAAGFVPPRRGQTVRRRR